MVTSEWRELRARCHVDRHPSPPTRAKHRGGIAYALLSSLGRAPPTRVPPAFIIRAMTRTVSHRRLESLGSWMRASDHIACFELLLTGAPQHGSIDRLPGLGDDRADRLVQHRLLRRP